MNLATETAETRRDAFTLAGERRGLLPLIMEKDFWVCWTLEQLFALPEIGPHLLFKGGTSLSKVYGAIQRFSEDIDLSLSRTFVEESAEGGPLADPMQASSNTQRKQQSEALVKAFHLVVTNRLLPALQAAIAEQLEGSDWQLSQDADDPGTLRFAHPKAVAGTLPYIRPEVRIELGGRSDDWPAEEKDVKAYVAEALPQVVPSLIPVRVLAARRTFWEKATLLHAEFHRPADKSFGERLSRHYSDLAQMAGTAIEEEALADLPLLAQVRLHKAAFYTAPWARYETAIPGTLRLSPPAERLDKLRSDYRSMQTMFFQRPLTFEQMMEKIAALEARINGQAP